MVDTVVFLARWVLAPEIMAALIEHGYYRTGEWYFEVVRRPDFKTGVTQVKIRGWHETLGIGVQGKDGVVERIQASLPRLLFGYNGRVIVTPFQLDESLDLLFEHLGEIATAEEELIEFVRIDLVLNLPCDPKRMVLAHHGARHPWVRSEDIQYGDGEIRFAGKERLFNFYWKQKEHSDKSGFRLPPLSKSLRVELQIKGRDAVRAVWSGTTRPGGTAKEQSRGDSDRGKEDWARRAVTHLDFFQCYRVYRHALCLFDKHPVAVIPGEKCTLHNLIAECEARDFRTSFGISAWEWFCLSGQKPATLNRVRRLVTQRKRELMQFRWADILPPLRLPEVVIDVYPDGREVELRNLW